MKSGSWALLDWLYIQTLSPEKVLLWNIIKDDMKPMTYWHHIWKKRGDLSGKSIEFLF